mmetsp:Transcript_11322/g.19061  ORF Transcript_11322/g.19061 Transcript_11322/m.19061 type:complete len:128 (+) Transcript_11322:371-754(+)
MSQKAKGSAFPHSSQPAASAGYTGFKTGGQIPQIEDDEEESAEKFHDQKYPFLPGMGRKGADQDLETKAKNMFTDLDLTEDNNQKENRMYNANLGGNDEAVDLDFEEESGSGDGNFDANELLNLSEY